MAHDTQVLAAWSRELVRSLVPEAEQPALLRSLEVPAEELWRQNGRLPHGVMCALWARLTERHADPVVGLRFAGQAQASAAGITGYLAMASGSGLEALARVSRYNRLIKADALVSVTASGEEVQVVDAPPIDLEPWPRHLAESVIGAYLFYLQRWSTAPLVPLRARFQHRAPQQAGAVAAVHRALGCPVDFGAADNALVLPREPLLAPLRTSDPELSTYLEPLASRMLAELPGTDDFAFRVRRAVAAALPAGSVRLERVAARLAITPRTLQRRLQAAGQSFQELVHEVRQNASQQLLGDPQLSVTEVAFLLGFSDPSGFRRAHKRWTGGAPRRPRQAQREAP